MTKARISLFLISCTASLFAFAFRPSATTVWIRTSPLGLPPSYTTVVVSQNCRAAGSGCLYTDVYGFTFQAYSKFTENGFFPVKEGI